MRKTCKVAIATSVVCLTARHALKRRDRLRGSLTPKLILIEAVEKLFLVAPSASYAIVNSSFVIWWQSRSPWYRRRTTPLPTQLVNRSSSRPQCTRCDASTTQRLTTSNTKSKKWKKCSKDWNKSTRTWSEKLVILITRSRLVCRRKK